MMRRLEEPPAPTQAPELTAPHSARGSEDVLPSDLRKLLGASNPSDRDRAWAQVVDAYSRLILSVARSVLSHGEDAMDAYAFVLEQLCDDDFRRLRKYAGDGRCKFTTWLVIVVRRVCVDFARQKYGRYGERDGPAENTAKALRRRLAQELVPSAELVDLVDHTEGSSERAVQSRELAVIVDATLAALPFDDRLLLKLRFQDDLSAAEIARALTLPTPFHVYRRLNALLASLRRTLEKRGVDGSEP